MILNETRNVLWHKNCKCMCKLNSSVCINKQIWNGNTCRCDCNEDFTGIINCAIGFIVFLIGFIYYYCRNNANKRKLRDFIYPKVKTSIY